MKTVLLGTSGAWPIPRPGCRCAQCEEARLDARFRRTRSSLYLEVDDEILLVDVGPDVFTQFERQGLPPRVDRVLLTHTHADHCLGLDDLVHLRRPRRTPLVVHAAPYHRERIAEIFPHLLRPDDPKVRFDEWEDGTRLEGKGVVLEGFETGHRATFPTTAVLLHVAGERGAPNRAIAYATDMGEMPETSRRRVEGIDLFLGDGSFLGAGGEGHPGTSAVIRMARTLGIDRVGFTHLGHVDVADAELRRRLGEGVVVAYDGDDLLAL